MYISNASNIKATIGIFAVVAIWMLAILFGMMTELKKRQNWELLFCMLAVAFAMLNDSLWYMYDGTATVTGSFINQLANFMVFLINPIIVILVFRYVYLLVEGKKDRVSKGLLYTVLAGTGLAIACSVTNLFVRWMYDFTPENVYYRMFGWYVYEAVCLVNILVLLIFLLRHRKDVGNDYFVAILLFILLPTLGIILQNLYIGFSFIYFGLGIGLLGILFVYLRHLFTGKESLAFGGKDKGYLTIVGCVSIVIILVSASVASSTVSTLFIAEKENLKNKEAIANLISGSFENEFIKPIAVTEAFAISNEIQNALSLDNLEGSQEEADMLRYMNVLRKEFGYQMVYCTSDKTKGYYTYAGLSRYVDQNDYDYWYSDFLATGKKYELNVDTDVDIGNKLGVFVNARVTSPEGELLGSTGVAVDMDQLVDLLEGFEQLYNADVKLVDQNGLVLIDTDLDNVLTMVVDAPYLSEVTAGELYTYQGNHIEMSYYMEVLDMYLIISFYEQAAVSVPHMVFPSAVIFLVGLFVMLVAMGTFFRFEHRRDAELLEQSHKAKFDELTTTHNRNAYENREQLLMNDDLPENFTVIIADINGLKSVNDNIGHEAGDELIIGAATCLKAVFGVENVYRIGGDEFAVLLECTKEECAQLLQGLSDCIASWKGAYIDSLSISVGCARHEDYLALPYKGLQHKADELMYADKNEYYRRTGRDRRKS